MKEKCIYIHQRSRSRLASQIDFKEGKNRACLVQHWEKQKTKKKGEDLNYQEEKMKEEEKQQLREEEQGLLGVQTWDESPWKCH